MNLKESIPHNIQNLFLNETIEFILESSSIISTKQNIKNLFPAIPFSAFGFLFLIAGSEIVEFRIISGLFLLLGALLTYSFVYYLLPHKRYFVGTEERLIICTTSKFDSLKWSEFEKNVKISGNNNKGTIEITTKFDNEKLVNDYEEYKSINPLVKNYKRLNIIIPLEIVGITNAVNIGNTIERLIVESNKPKLKIN